MKALGFMMRLIGLMVLLPIYLFFGLIYLLMLPFTLLDDSKKKQGNPKKNQGDSKKLAKENARLKKELKEAEKNKKLSRSQQKEMKKAMKKAGIAWGLMEAMDDDY